MADGESPAGSEPRVSRRLLLSAGAAACALAGAGGVAAGLLHSGVDSDAAPPATTVWGLAAGDLTAIDAASGKKRWSRPVGSAYATPVIRDGICYVNGTDSVYAFDALTGAVRWHRRMPLAGSSSSLQDLFFRSGVVYAIVAGSGTYVGIYALDADTGVVRWRVPEFEFDSAQYADGVLALSQGNSGVGDIRILALDAVTGQTRFRRGGICLASLGAPSAPGRLNPVGLGGFFLVGQPSAVLAGRFYRLDPRSWRYVTTYPVCSSVLAVTATALVTSLVSDVADGVDGSTLQAADIATGTLLWSVRLSSSPSPRVQVQGSVLTAGISLGAMALDLRSGKTLWTYHIREKYDASVIDCAHSGGSVFLAVAGLQSGSTEEDKASRVMSLDSGTGTVRWSVRMPGGATLLSAGGSVFTLVRGESIYALDAATGRTKWAYPVDGQLFLAVS